ncbi:hypothetical protein ABEF95_012411 [Exophiala dermatitidis]
MVEIPILVSTPSLQHTIEVENSGEYSFGSVASESTSQQPSLGTAQPTPEEISSHTMVSHSTQTVDDEGTPKGQSPSHSQSESRTRTPTHHSWAEALRQRIANPHSRFHSPTAVDASGRTMLAPGGDPIQRATTPAADLYKGQCEANFGMTFDHHSTPHPHFLRAAKPHACPYSLEDQKHRMTMDWIDRRN